MTIDKNLYIHLIASGDESAFRQFITSNAPSCYRYAWRILKRKELAEEAVCEVFVAVWENRKHLPEIENTGAWLHRLTLHKSVSLLRKESRWDLRKERITESELDIPDFYEEPDYDAETVSLLNRAIGDLPEKCRQVFYLARIEKMSYREISRIMGISVKTVSNPRYSVKFTYDSYAVVNSEKVASEPKAVAGINAGYEPEAIYIMIDGRKISGVTLPPDHLRYWKHEACIFSSGDRTVGIFYGGKDGEKAIGYYDRLVADNIIASAPMLIDDYKPLGETFVDVDMTESQLEQAYDYEDYRRHQGVRHPRTAYALTADNDLLLIAVDGRWSGRAEGMNAKELTKFIVRYFNPQWAINMDGGGSTTLTVKGRGHSETNVVNYPTDGGSHDHTGERTVTTHLLILDNNE